MKKLLLIALMVLPLAAGAQTVTITVVSGQDIRFTLNSSTHTAVVASYNSVSGDMVIPDNVTYNGESYSVTELASSAFINNPGLTSVVIGDNVISIGSYAFCYCNGLTSVTLGDGVTTIGTYAFQECNNLSTVNYIGTIGDWFGISFGDSYTSNPTFYSHGLSLNGTELTELVIPDNVTSIANNAFKDWTGLTSVNTGSGVTSIGTGAFQGCTGLTSVTIGSGVTTVGGSAFYGCTGLTSVTIGSGVTSVGSSAFYGCNNLSVVNYLGDIGGWLGIDFSYYNNSPTNITHSLYLNGVEVTELVIPDNITSIAYNAFRDWTGLTSVVIGNGVTSIGSYAFRGCTGLTSVTIGSSVDTICSSAFYDCSNITTVNYVGDMGGWLNIGFGDNYSSSPTYYTHSLQLNGVEVADMVIPDNVTSIRDYAFKDWTGLISVTIGNGVTSIGRSAFEGCLGLTSVTIGSGVTSVGDWAFNNCDNLSIVNYIGTIDGWLGISFGVYADPTTYTHGLYLNGVELTELIIPDNVTTIAYGAFKNWTGLTSVTIGSGVTHIGCSAFNGCSNINTVNYTGDIAGWLGINFECPNSNPTNITHSLYLNGVEVTELVIPDNITSIANNTFKDWTRLTSVTIGSGVTTIGDYAFSGCTGLTSVTIGNGVTSIGSYAFYYCSGLTSVTIGSGVTSVSNHVFEGCSNLSTVNYTGTISGWFGITFGVWTSNPTDITHSLYLNGTELTELVIPDNVTSIANNAFNNWTGLTSVNTGSGVTTIGSSAFQGCTGLTAVTIGSGVTSVGSSAFSGCNNLSVVNYIGDIASWLGINFGYNSNPTSYSHSLYLNGMELTELVIPNSVTSIGENAFNGWTTLTSVSIGDGVTSIGGSAFSGCTELTSVTIGSGVISIGGSAFYGCSGLTSVTFGSSVTSIGAYAFASCGMQTMTVPDAVQSIGYNAFQGVNILYYHGTATGSPWGATYLNGEISNGLYYTIGADSMYTLHVGANVTYINDNILYYQYRPDLIAIEVESANTTFSSAGGVLYNRAGTTLLRFPPARTGNLTIGPNVTLAKAGSLNGCTIDTLFLNASSCAGEYYNSYSNTERPLGDDATTVQVLEVSDEVDVLATHFTELPGVQYINVDPDNWTYHSAGGMLMSSDGHTVVRCPRARAGAMVMPAVVLNVGDNAFENCTEIISLDLGNVSSIGEYAFSGCTGITSLTLGNVSSIGEYAFSGCTGITSLTLGNVHHVGDYAFSGCTGITDGLDLGNVQYLGSYAFAGCTGIGTLTIPATVDTLKNMCFSDCIFDTLYYNAPNAFTPNNATSILRNDSLRTVIVGDNVETLPTKIFRLCSNLENINLPEGLTTIGGGALEGTALSRVSFPSSLTTIGSGAFDGCLLLDSVTIPPSVVDLGGAFYNCPNLKTFFYNVVSVHKWDTVFQRQRSEPIYNSYGDLVNWTYDTVPVYIGYRYNGNSTSLFGGTTHVSNLFVGEGVHDIYAIWQQGVDTLTLPQSLQYVTSAYSYRSGNGTLVNLPTTSNLRYVYFNCKNLTYLCTSTNNVQNQGASTYVHVPYIDEEAHGVFPGGTQIRHVVFGDSVQSLPTYCFKGCSQVREFVNLALPASVTSIGSGAFEGCTQMQSALIAESVTSVGAAPFLKCSQLSNITFNAAHAEFCNDDVPLPSMSRAYSSGSVLSYNNIARAGMGRTSKVALREWLPSVDTINIGPNVHNITPCLVGYPYNQIVDTVDDDRITYVINQSNKIATISYGAFANLNLMGAESLFSDSLMTVGDGAFMNSSGITKAYLGEGATAVGDAAFRNCQSLDSVWLPSTLELIGTDAFLKDSSLVYLYYDCESAYINHYDPQACTPFGNTVALRTIDFGPNVRYLNEAMFKNAEGLERVDVPEGVQWIDDNCFYMTVPASSNGSSSNSSSANSPKIVVHGGGYYSGTVDTCRLRYVTLPSTLWYVGNDVFNGCPLDTLACLAAEPPILRDLFPNHIEQNTRLLVPCGSLQDYLDYSDTVYYNSVGYYVYRWNSIQHISEQSPFNLNITVNVDTMGTVDWVCGNGGVVMTATPAASHRFLQWSDGVTDNPRTVALYSDSAFQAVFAWGVLYDVTVNSSDALRGTVTGSGTFVQESVDTLTATPLYGYHFDHWSDGDTTNPRYLTVTGNTTVTATFLPNQYTLNVYFDSAQGGVSGGGVYDYNTSNSITAIAATGYHFTEWTDSVTDNPRIVTLTCDTSFTALFAINVYALTVTCDSTQGSVVGGGEYIHGDTAAIVATAAVHWHFLQWSDGVADNPRVVTMTSDSALTALFALDNFSVTVVSGEGGTASASAATVEYGSTVTITATPVNHYHFTQWSDGNTSNPRTVTITSDTIFEALFDINSYTLTVETMGEGSVSGGGSYTAGATATLIATPDSGYHFLFWQDNNTQNPRTVTVNGNATYTAYFAADAPTQYTLTVTSANPTMGSVSGGGTYDAGAIATLIATPNSGYHFVRWQDNNTQNPRTVTVNANAIYTAYFEANSASIDDIDNTKYTIEISGLTVTINNPDGETVALYDITGRLLASSHLSISNYQLPTPGVYLVRVGDLPAHRVVVTGE